MEIKNNDGKVKNVTIIGVDKNVDDNINYLCAKHKISRDFFFEKAIENYCALIELDPKLVGKMNDLCIENKMSKVFFLTKAIENYCKNLARKKKTNNK